MIRLITTIACDHTGGDNQRCSSSAGYLDSYSNRIHPCSSFFHAWSSPVFSTLRTPADFFFCNSLDTCALSFINVGLNITAMTGKLAEKLPLTMSSLINTIPDSLYPEEDIPTSMNIFTNTESINHYSQMNTGKILIYFSLCVFSLKWSKVRCARKATVVSGLWSTCLRSPWLLRTKTDSCAEYFFEVRCNTVY